MNRRIVTAASALLGAAVLSGCGPVLDSANLTYSDATTCSEDSLGSYHLPRQRVVLTVTTHKGTGTNPARHELTIADALETSADPAHHYCLGYLTSATSADRIGINRSAEGLLKRVYSNTSDRSVTIAERLIDAGANLAIAGGAGVPIARETGLDPVNPAATSVTLRFDPFDWHESQQINLALRRYGFCAYVARGRGATLDEFAPTWSEGMCPNPATAPRPTVAAPRIATAPRNLEGIAYKPLLGHRLVVLQNPDPGSYNNWREYQSRYVNMTNAAPVLAIQVNRSAFVDRKTNVEFDNGILRDVTIEKPSEALAFIEIPLRLVVALTQIPFRALTFEADAASNREELIKAQAALLSATRQFNAELAKKPETPADPGPEAPVLEGATDAPRSALTAVQQEAVAECIASEVTLGTPAPDEKCRELVLGEN